MRASAVTRPPQLPSSAMRNATLLLDTSKAALLLGLSPRTLEKFRITGGGPVYRKLGRRVLYDPDDLRVWVDLNLRTSTAEPGSEAGSSPRP
jgi:hypothetical protein